MKSFKRLILMAMVVLAGLIGVQATAHAVPTLEIYLYDGVNPSITVQDQMAGDSNPTLGAVTFVGSVGAWTVDVTTGLSYPALGSPTQPKLDLHSVSVSGGPGSLVVAASAIGFLTTGGAVFQGGGTTEGQVSFSAWSDPADLFLGKANPIGSLGPFGPGAFSGTVSGPTGAGFPYSLTIEASIEHKTEGASSFDAGISVPEPSVMLLLGAGLVGIWGFRKKFKK